MNETAPPVRAAVVMGSRLCPWHAEAYRFLGRAVRATAFGTTLPRYPLEGVPLPVELLRWQNEVGPWPLRKLRNLRYRLTHGRTGFDFDLAPCWERLAAHDVVQTWELFTPWTRQALEARRRRGTPVLVTVWDNIPFNHAGDARCAEVRKRALAEADRFLVVTELSEAALREEGVEAERVVRLAPAVDPERFKPAPDVEARRGLGLGAEEEVVLCVARLVPEKGVRHLLEGLARLVPGRPGLRLLVVGSGPQRGELEAHAQRPELAGRVRFAGEVAWTRMPAFYAAADLFVLPSVPTRVWQEQWGQSLLEAMAAGLPAVASLTGGVPEVLGEAGVTVPPAAPAALAEAMAGLLENETRRRDLADRARQRVRAAFDARSLGPQLARLLGELAGRRS